jgi:small-conductance mechanosensitive channel
MPYYRLGETCDNYCEPSTALTNNRKFVTPFLPNGKIKIYPIDNFRVNSYEYNNNNLYSYDKSYNNIVKSYKHFTSQVSDIKTQLFEKEKDLLVQTEKELNNLRVKIQGTTTPVVTTSK